MEIDGMRGQLITADHTDYDSARTVWNGAVNRRPRLIARCSGTADMVAAVRLARDHDLQIAVRGEGHNVAGTAVCDDGIVIDLSAMRAVWVDPPAARSGCRAVRCGATSTTRPSLGHHGRHHWPRLTELHDPLQGQLGTTIGCDRSNGGPRR